MEWLELVLTTVAGSLIAALAVIYTQRKADQRAASVAELERDERQAQREADERRHERDQRAALRERWRDTRRDSHTSLLRALNEARLGIRVEILRYRYPEWVQRAIAPPHDLDGLVQASYDALAEVDLIGSDAAREAARDAINRLDDLRQALGAVRSADEGEDRFEAVLNGQALDLDAFNAARTYLDAARLDLEVD